MPPITRPPTTMGAPPRVGKTSPCATIGITCQKPQPLAPSVVNSAVLRRNAAAAVALAREVSGLKKPVPSPRALRTRRPASSTTVTVIGARRARAFAWAALTAVSAISSVMSIIVLSPSDERVVVEVLPGRHERDQVMLERARKHLGEALGGPALGVVHAHDRALVAEEHDLLASHAEDLRGDVLGRVARQEDGDGRDVGGGELLDLLDPRLLRLGLGRDRADHARPGERRDAVRRHVVARHVERRRLGETEDTELRGGVVRPTHVAYWTRGRGHA